MPEATSPVLELQGITKTFQKAQQGHVKALNNVDLELRPAHCVGLVGASGSGKSTLAKIIMKLLPADVGVLKFKNEIIPFKSNKVQERGYRKNVQMIFQDPFASLNPVHTVEYPLSRAFKQHHHDHTSIRENLCILLERVGLTPPDAFLAKKPFELSGGQRQRVAIARALAVEPTVIIADEPTSMLDASIRADILELLNALKVEKQLSMLLITHDLVSARFLCDTICVINEGEIVESGPIETVLKSPQDKYTQKLLAASPKLPELF